MGMCVEERRPRNRAFSGRDNCAWAVPCVEDGGEKTVQMHDILAGRPLHMRDFDIDLVVEEEIWRLLMDSRQALDSHGNIGHCSALSEADATLETFGYRFGSCIELWEIWVQKGQVSKAEFADWFRSRLTTDMKNVNILMSRSVYVKAIARTHHKES